MEYLMKRIVNVQKVIEKSNGPLTPAATALFKKIEIKAKAYRVNYLSIFLFSLVLVLSVNIVFKGSIILMKFEGNMEWWTQVWC